MVTDFHILCSSAPASVLADMMKALAARSVLNRAMSVTTSDGLNALEVALLHGHVTAVNTLLQRAGRLCFQLLRVGRRCVVHHAVQGGSGAAFDLLRRFLKKYGSANRNTESHLHFQTLLDWRDEQDHTPLTLACSLAPKSQLVEFLLLAGAEIGSVNSKSGYTALMYACAAGSVGLVGTLLSVTRSDQEMLANVSGVDVHTEDALSRHIRFNAHSRRLVLGRDGYDLGLTTYSSNPGHRDVNGRQAIHIAALAGHASICSMLIKIGVPIITRDNCGCNIFHILAEVGNESLLRDFIREERERWKRYINETLPHSLELMIGAVLPLLELSHHSQSPADTALLNGHSAIATLLLDSAEEIYSSIWLSHSQREAIEALRRRIEHVRQLSDVMEHKEAEEKKPDDGIVIMSSERAGQIAEEQFADELDYRFAVTAWTAKLMGLSEGDD